MITKSTNRSGERRVENLRIHEDRMDLLGTIHEMIEAEFVKRGHLGASHSREHHPLQGIPSLLPSLLFAVVVFCNGLGHSFGGGKVEKNCRIEVIG